MAQAVPAESPSTLSQPLYMKHGDRILIVEDDADLGGLLCDLLRTEGYDPVRVEDGDEAVRLVAQDPPDAVVLDVMLPGMDGFEVCERLRADPQTAGLPVVVISALDDQESRERAERVGVSAYYTKPFKPLELLEYIGGLGRGGS